MYSMLMNDTHFAVVVPRSARQERKMPVSGGKGKGRRCRDSDGALACTQRCRLLRRHPSSLESLMRCSAVLLLLAVAAGCASPPRTETSPAPVRNAAPSMADDLRRDLFAFADDSMLGRSAETPNAARAARFIAARLRA
ncbi:MAG: hypothetical protein JJD97_07085, partial [Gemmatimonadaceae bacterium]|nr:hypothetical protein [Gemmatimonadaceae bacterium]